MKNNRSYSSMSLKERACRSLIRLGRLEKDELLNKYLDELEIVLNAEEK